MRAYQVLDASDPAARRIVKYMVGGVRCPSIDPKEIAVPPFHDLKVVDFFCEALYEHIHRGRGRTKGDSPITLKYSRDEDSPEL